MIHVKEVYAKSKIKPNLTSTMNQYYVLKNHVLETVTYF